MDGARNLTSMASARILAKGVDHCRVAVGFAAEEEERRFGGAL